MVDSPIFILDSFAVLAYLTDEPSAARIEKLIEDAKEEKIVTYFCRSSI